jgi:predicted transcriptional regulator
MKKRELMDEIQNFIEYAYSDDVERQWMLDVARDYMLDVYEAPPKNVHFIRKTVSVLVRVDNMPEFWILPSESESYQKQFLELGYTIYIS